ncbi:MAG: DinB family protein, partial [Bacteroidota bacterium]
SRFSELADMVNKTLDSATDASWENEPVELKINGNSILTIPRMQMMWFFFFDVIHHRGQLSSYVRPMGGKNPAVYGYSADTIG